MQWQCHHRIFLIDSCIALQLLLSIPFIYCCRILLFVQIMRPMLLVQPLGIGTRAS